MQSTFLVIVSKGWGEAAVVSVNSRQDMTRAPLIAAGEFSAA